jgi:hypothetical protein
VHIFERFEKARRDRHGAVYPSAAFLKAFENQHPAANINAGRRQGQRLGNTAPGVRQRFAEGPDFARRILRGADEIQPFGWRQVLALARAVVNLHQPRSRSGCSRVI